MTTTILLGGIPLFAGLSPYVLAPLQASCRSVKLEKGEVLFKRGERGREMYIVESGQIYIWLETADGRELHLADLGPNEVLGELEIIDGKPRSASARATEYTRLIALPREALFEQLGANPGMAIHLMTVLSERLRSNNERQLHLRESQQKPEARLATLLLLLADNSPDGVIRHFRTQDMAHLLATEPAHIEFSLHQWSADKIIHFLDETTLKIQEPMPLRAMAVWA